MIYHSDCIEGLQCKCRSVTLFDRCGLGPGGKMASSSSELSQHEDYVRRRIEVDRVTHKQLSEELCASFPGVRGFSVRSIECFCSERSIHKTSRLTDSQVHHLVKKAVAKVKFLPFLKVIQYH